MANKLFESLRGKQSPAPAMVPQNLNTPSFWNQVEQMKKTIPNPQAEVQRLLASGEMSQAEFQQISQIANQMMGNRPR